MALTIQKKIVYPDIQTNAARRQVTHQSRILHDRPASGPAELDLEGGAEVGVGRVSALIDRGGVDGVVGQRDIVAGGEIDLKTSGGVALVEQKGVQAGPDEQPVCLIHHSRLDRRIGEVEVARIIGVRDIHRGEVRIAGIAQIHREADGLGSVVHTEVRGFVDRDAERRRSRSDEPQKKKGTDEQDGGLAHGLSGTSHMPKGRTTHLYTFLYRAQHSRRAQEMVVPEDR